MPSFDLFAFLPQFCPFPSIDLGYFRHIAQKENIFRVPVRSCGRIVETASFQVAAVNDHEFVMEDGVTAVDPHGHALVREEGHSGIFAAVGFGVRHKLHGNAAPVRVPESFGYGLAGEGAGSARIDFSALLTAFSMIFRDSPLGEKPT